MEYAKGPCTAFSGKNNMNDMTKETGAVSASSNTLWAAIGVLGVVVISLASALYFVQTREETLRDANINGILPAPVATPATPAVAPEPIPEPPRAAEKKPAKPKHATPTGKPATSAGKPDATATPATAPSTAPQVKEICLNCGTVTAATPVEREGAATGTGAVAGGVLGALLGNQVGRGQGKDVATVLGAIGGGVAGNVVEKKMKKVTVYQLQVRMDDGSTRSIEQADPVGVGVRVRVQGDSLQPLAPAN
jgi:outer membrane lipoprotein SlyB